MTIYHCPAGVAEEDFGKGLGAINRDAFTVIDSDGENCTVDWDDDIATFPTVAEINAGITKINWKVVREERNKRLAETDFYALSDVTMSAEMETYRQALRDITAGAKTYDFTTGKQSGGTKVSTDVVWPTKP
jgi:hypothetical protein